MEKFLINSKTLVILDNGHGEDTPGKRSPIWRDGSQLFEWAFNRILVKYIKDYLKLGVSYIILVPENEDILLHERVTRIEEIKKDLKDDYELIYVVSIHGNAAEDSRANGVEVFTSRGITLADPLSKVFFNRLKSLGWKMRKGYEDEYPDKEANFTILKGSESLNVPAILTESGFYTNEEECKKMLTFEYHKLIAKAHYDAIFEIEKCYKNEQNIWEIY